MIEKSVGMFVVMTMIWVVREREVKKSMTTSTMCINVAGESEVRPDVR